MQTIKHRTNDGVRNGLCIAKGRKFYSCVFFDPKPLTVKKVDLDDPGFEITSETEKCVSNAVAKFTAEAKAHGCTKAVAEALGIKPTKGKSTKSATKPAKRTGGGGPTVLAREALYEFVEANKFKGEDLRVKEHRDACKAFMREKSPEAAAATINTQFAVHRKALEDAA